MAADVLTERCISHSMNDEWMNLHALREGEPLRRRRYIYGLQQETKRTVRTEFFLFFSLLLWLIQAGLNTFCFSRRCLCCGFIQKSQLIRWFVRTSLLFCCCLCQSEREQNIPDGGQHPGHHIVQTCRVNSWGEHGVPASVCVWPHFTRDKEDGRKNIQE